MRLSTVALIALGFALAHPSNAQSRTATPEQEEAGYIRVLPVDEPFDTISVSTSAGTLVGEQVDDVNIFRGVPYAASPVGALRWKPPQPVSPWKGERAALAFEPPCPQPVSASAFVPNQGGVVGASSEDCLYLEVYAPAEAENAPVVLWLHGGGAFLGAGHLGSYVGTANAQKGVITVAINYRLGPLGYFAHPAITAEGDLTGSYAMMDAVSALEWIQENIKSFGGDTDNVTVAGQSAGGVMVAGLLATPSAKGLFEKAVIQSGAFLFDGIALEDAEKRSVRALKRIGVPENATAEQLRGISAQTFSYSGGLRRGFGAIMDGNFLTETAKDALAEGTETDVPVLIGTNSGEPGFDAARYIAAQTGKKGAGAFLYQFSYVPLLRKEEWTNGPIHSAELMFTFDSLDTSGWAKGKTTTADIEYAKRMSSCWVAFYKMPADSKEISCAGLAWPAYSEESQDVASFGDSIRIGRADDFPDGPEAGSD